MTNSEQRSPAPVNYTQARNCALLSKDIYQNFSQIKFEALTTPESILIDRKETDVQCAVLREPNSSTVYIVFRGSEARADWETNFDFKQTQFEFRAIIQEEILGEQEKIYPYGESQSGALMHQGFTRAYLSVRTQLHDYFKSTTATQAIVTGHSLGGALAVLCAVDIQYNFGDRVAVTTYTFGAPRVGNQGFVESFDRRVPNSYRFVYGMDIVTNVPRTWQGYRHVSTELRLGPRFSLNFLSRRFRDHSIQNYIDALKQA